MGRCCVWVCVGEGRGGESKADGVRKKKASFENWN